MFDIQQNMASVGLLNSQLEVWVWANDPRQIPHFHIWDKATQGKMFHSCVKLESPEYFTHGDKTDKLNSKMRKQLSEFMNATDEDSGNTNWWATIYAWNKNNSSHKVPMDMSMPDYRLLTYDVLFEYANIIKADHAELPSNIFISQNNGYQHGPRIKFQTNKAGKVQRNSMATMTISDSPQIIGDVGELSAGDVQYFKSFVLNNKDVLLAYWNAEIEIERVLSLLRY